MRQGFVQTQRLDTTLRIDPRVLLSARLLQLAQPDLEQEIERELNENPALVRLEEPEAPPERDILRTVAPRELAPTTEEREFHRSVPGEDAVDWQDFVAGDAPLQERLRAQVLPGLQAKTRAAAAFLIGSLDATGYLGVSVEEAALAVDASLEEVEAALARIHACEPAGIGARDLRECLLLQLAHASTLEEKLARRIIRDHLDDLAARRTLNIARRFGVLPDVVEAAYGVIRALAPYPVSEPDRSELRGRAVQPDLILSRSEQGWSILVAGSGSEALHLDRQFLAISRGRAGSGHRVDRAERRHASHYVQRAQQFMECLDQRRETLRRIGIYLLERQSGFLATGDYAFLLPLTRSKMASDLGLHESTVSRATADKFVQIATGEVISFDVFFKPALRVQKLIEEILATEDPRRPLSDERIAEMLAARGVQVARRTVNKYRDRTKLLSSRRRRSA